MANKEGIETPPGFEETKQTAPAVEITPVVAKEKGIATWAQALTALPEKFKQLKFDERRTTVELGYAMQIIKGNASLQKCDPKSIFDAVIYAARIEITLNPAFAFAYLVPRGNKCCLDIGYRGWCAAVKSYGVCKHLDAYVVYEDEFFEWTPSDQYLKHVPVMVKTEKEQKERTVVAAYAMAILLDGTKVYEVIPVWELQKIKAVSPASKGFSPYTSWESEMTRKAPIKRLAKKLLPLQNDEKVRAMFETEHEQDQQPSISTAAVFAESTDVTND